jgi:hypothetical protein
MKLSRSIFRILRVWDYFVFSRLLGFYVDGGCKDYVDYSIDFGVFKRLQQLPDLFKSLRTIRFLLDLDKFGKSLYG